MKRHIISIIVSAALMASCSVAYKRPDVEVSFRPVQVQDSAGVSADSVCIAQLAWNEFHTDTILCGLIDTALMCNLDMQVALKRLEQSASYFKQSRWAYAPVIGADASAGYARSSLGAEESPYFTVGLSASWEIDIWGRLTKAKRAAFEQMLAAEDTRNAIQTQIVAEVARAYYTLISLDMQKKFVQETIASREEYYRTVCDLKEAAHANEVAVLQAEAQLSAARAYIPTLERAIRETENALCLLLGEPSGEIRRSAGMNPDSLNYHSAGVPVEILGRRPDVMAAEHSLRSALHGYNSAVAAQYPSLTLSGNVSSDAAMFEKWFSMPSSILWGVLGGLVQPILNGRALKTQKEVAYKEFEIAQIEFRRSVLNAGMEVSNAMFAIKSDRELVELQKEQCLALEKAYEYSVELMINGYATYLDVLSAQEGVFNSRIALINNTLNVVNDHIDLYRALGGGWRSGY